jgi:hypothetical protein
MSPKVEQSITSLRRTSLVAIGGKADIGRSCYLLGPTRLTHKRHSLE